MNNNVTKTTILGMSRKVFISIVTAIVIVVAIDGVLIYKSTKKPAKKPAANSDQTTSQQDKKKVVKKSNKEILLDFISGEKSVHGSDIPVTVGCRTATTKTGQSYEEYYPIVGESGIIGYHFFNDDQNVFVAYCDGDNKLIIKSYGVDGDDNVELLSGYDSMEFLDLSDQEKISIYQTTLPNGKQAFMVENWGQLSSTGDGVTYGIGVYEINEDGTLTETMSDETAGSGDEDITADLRNTYNSAVGANVNQERFERAFYDEDLLINDAADASEFITVEMISKYQKEMDAGQFGNTCPTYSIGEEWGTFTIKNVNN